jgi:ubiquinone/menaquinone biosynthesis C-methylase UbiE
MSRKENLDQQTVSRRLVHNLFSIFFRFLYNEFAWSYDLVANFVSLGKWKSWTFTILPYLDKPNILELGYGPGHLQVSLRQDFASSYGIDASKYMARQASSRLRQRGYNPNLVIGKTQFLPYPHSAFNYVISTFPSEYIFDPQTLEEVWRVLDHSGELIVLANAWITGDRFLERILAWLFRRTHQSPDFDIASTLDHYIPKSSTILNRFRFKTEILTRESSKLLILRGRKMDPTDQ